MQREFKYCGISASFPFANLSPVFVDGVEKWAVYSDQSANALILALHTDWKTAIEIAKDTVDQMLINNEA